MYYTGIDPYTGKKIFVARNIEEKRKQKEYFFWYKKDQWPKGVTAQRHNGTKGQKVYGPKGRHFSGSK
jgi:hypothetical protein